MKDFRRGGPELSDEIFPGIPRKTLEQLRIEQDVADLERPRESVPLPDPATHLRTMAMYDHNDVCVSIATPRVVQETEKSLKLRAFFKIVGPMKIRALRAFRSNGSTWHETGKANLDETVGRVDTVVVLHLTIPRPSE